MGKTTIKVLTQLRDSINHEARERGLPAVGLIENLLDAYERRRRMDAFGRAFRAADAEYWDELAAWDLGTRALSDDR